MRLVLFQITLKAINKIDVSYQIRYNDSFEVSFYL